MNLSFIALFQRQSNNFVVKFLHYKILIIDTVFRYVCLQLSVFRMLGCKRRCRSLLILFSKVLQR